MFDSTANVADIMSEDVIYLLPNERMTRVRTIFEEYPIHHIPIVDDDGMLVGILSKSDYLTLLDFVTLFNTKKAQRSNDKLLESLIVEEVMTPKVMTVTADVSLSYAAEILLENIFHALPVVDDQKRLVGILTSHDLLRHAYQGTSRSNVRANVFSGS